MKLIRVGNQGSEKPGLYINEDHWIDVSSIINDYDEAFSSDEVTSELTKANNSPENFPKFDTSTRLGAPLKRPSKIICVGLNYAKHAKEAGMDIPQNPLLFFKSTTAICGPYDDLVIPKNAEKVDWEVELAIVIGKRASYVSKEEAMDYVYGYVLHNDYSERAYQLEHGGQWVKGKSCDTFAPLGPYVVSKDEIKDPNNLKLWLTVNGEKVQDSSTSDFIFKIDEVVSYISQYMTLLPGDIITTGTPEGVGLGFKPPRYVKAGDQMEYSVEGLGVGGQKAVPYSG